MIDQMEFSQRIKSHLSEIFPDFISTIKYHDDCSFDCSVKSPTDKFSIWIATYNSEITLGLEDPDNLSNCHAHISCHENDLEELRQLDKMLIDMFENRIIFYRSSLSGFSWTNDTVETLKEKRGNEIIDFFTWTGEI